MTLLPEGVTSPIQNDSLGSRTRNGRTILSCPEGDSQCTETQPGFVVVRDAAGVEQSWYEGELAPADLQDIVFQRSGEGLWLLFHRTDGRTHLVDLVRMNSPHNPEIVASVDVGTCAADWTWCVGGFREISPDDSLLIIEARHSKDVFYSEYLVGVDGSAVFLDPDFPAGLADATEADSWPGGEFSPDTTP